MNRNLILVAGIIGLIITLALYLLNWHYRAVSFAIGAAAAVIYLFLLNLQARKIIRLSKTGNVKKKAVQGIFFRYLLLIGVMVLAASFKNINYFYLLGGIILIPLSAFIAGSIGTKNDEKG